jgi:hypothetical protein
MKLARTIAVLTVIVVFPAMSWYYLNRGAAWRIQGLEAMRDKQAIELPRAPLIDDNGAAVAELGADFIIAVNVDPNKEISDLNKIAELFSHRSDVLLLSFNGGTDELDEAWTILDCAISPCKEWSAQLFTDDTNAALIDDSLYIRNTYDLRVEGQMKLLAEHGVILFPVEKSRKIKLKRGENEK